MTEEEAKTKWCPQSMLDAKIDAYGNLVKQVNNGNCIGSDCMAWRWKEFVTPLVSRAEREDWSHVAADESEDGTEFWVEPPSQAQSRRRGFCGLAGKP